LHASHDVRRTLLVMDSETSGLPLAPGESRRIVDEPLFRYLVDLEVVKAQRLSYCFSVICVAPDLPLPHAGAMSEPHVFAAVLRCTRATDNVTRLADGAFAILAIDADTPALAPIVARVLDEVRAAAGPVATTTTWSAGAACYPKTAVSPAEVLRIAADLLNRARHDGGARVYITS
jgi:hypothetical protein